MTYSTLKKCKKAQKMVDLRSKIQHNIHMMQNKAQNQQMLRKNNTTKKVAKTVDFCLL